MSRLAERHIRKASSGTSGVGSRSRSAKAIVRAGARLSAASMSSQTDAAGPVTGRTVERHDWLVPLELP